MGGLLNSSDKEKIKRAIPKANNKLIDATVARLYIAYPEPTRWQYTNLMGAIILADDLVGHTFFLKLVDIIGHRGVIWDQELYVDFQYHQDRTFFHTFELEDCWAGLLFEDTSEASHFYKRVVNRHKYGSKQTVNNKNAIALKEKVKSDTRKVGPRGEYVNVNTEQRMRRSKGVLYYDDVPPPEWRSLYSELEAAGITEDMIADNREFIKDYIAKRGGPLVGLEPPVPRRLKRNNSQIQRQATAETTESKPSSHKNKKAPPPPPPTVVSRSSTQASEAHTDVSSTNSDHFGSSDSPSLQQQLPHTSSANLEESHSLKFRLPPKDAIPPSVPQSTSPHPPPLSPPQKVPYQMPNSNISSGIQPQGSFSLNSQQSRPLPPPPPARGSHAPPPPARGIPPTMPLRTGADGTQRAGGIPPPPPPRAARGNAPPPPPPRTQRPGVSSVHPPPPPNGMNGSQSSHAQSYSSAPPLPPAHPSAEINYPNSQNQVNLSPSAHPAHPAPPLPPQHPNFANPQSQVSSHPPPRPLPQGAHNDSHNAPPPPPVPPASTAPSSSTGPPPPPPLPPSELLDTAASGSPPPLPATDSSRDALLSSIRSAGIGSLRKVDKSQLDKPSVILQEAKGDTSTGGNGLSDNPPPGQPGSLADALASALHKRKGKVAGSDDEDDGDDW